MNILKHNRNLLTLAEWLQQTQLKRAETILFSKYAANDWLRYNRSSKDAINLKYLSCRRYVEHIDKLKVLKVNGLKAVLTFADSK